MDSRVPISWLGLEDAAPNSIIGNKWRRKVLKQRDTGGGTWNRAARTGLTGLPAVFTAAGLPLQRSVLPRIVPPRSANGADGRGVCDSGENCERRSEMLVTRGTASPTVWHQVTR